MHPLSESITTGGVDMDNALFCIILYGQVIQYNHCNLVLLYSCFQTSVVSQNVTLINLIVIGHFVILLERKKEEKIKIKV